MSPSCQGIIVITFEIFISTNKTFFKVQYFPSQFFYVCCVCEKLNISGNNIISVEPGTVAG
jgi:hypothetical protein